MRYALDTSVLVRILTGLPQPLAANVAMALEKKRRAGDSFVVSNLVLSEAYYAVQHHYGVDKAAALVALRELSLQRGFEFPMRRRGRWLCRTSPRRVRDLSTA